MNETAYTLGFAAFLGLSFGLAQFANIAIHELGHVLIAKLLGWRVDEVRIGKGEKPWIIRRGGFRLKLCAWPSGGWAMVRPRTASWFRTRYFLIVLAGPVASLLVFAGFLALGSGFFAEPLSIAWQLSTWVALGFFVCSVWPHQTEMYGHQVPSDGLLLWQILRMKRDQIAQNFFAHELGRVVWLIENEQPREARDQAKRVLALPQANTDLKIQLGLAQLHSEIGDVDGAAQLYRDLLSRVPQDTDLWRDTVDAFACLPIYHERRDLLVEACALIRRAVAQFPNAVTLRGTLGSVLFELGERVEARALLEAVCKESKAPLDIAISSGYLAVLSAEAGRYEESAALAKTARERGNEHRLVQRLLRMTDDLAMAGR
jgi:thioredoxin-like negative regulator of GroEL